MLHIYIYIQLVDLWCMESILPDMSMRNKPGMIATASGLVNRVIPRVKLYSEAQTQHLVAASDSHNGLLTSGWYFETGSVCLN